MSDNLLTRQVCGDILRPIALAKATV